MTNSNSIVNGVVAGVMFMLCMVFLATAEAGDKLGTAGTGNTHAHDDMFNNNPKLKYWFVYEAASGKKKFGDTTATADLVIEFDPTKKEKNAIKKYKNLNQKTDIDNLVKETEFFVAFKTGQKSPFSAMRTRRAKIEKKANEQLEFDNIDDMPT